MNRWIIFGLALLNFIAICVLMLRKKYNWAISLAIVLAVLVAY